ncbi:MAG: CHAT domain-containing protein, partial [Bacteroidetes bacterium]
DARAGTLYAALGYAYRKTERNYVASIALEKARLLSEQYDGVIPNKNPAGPIHKTLANIKTRLGDNDEAINILISALNLLERDTIQARQADNRLLQAKLYGDLGIAYQNEGKEDFETALNYYASGLEVLNHLQPSDADFREDVDNEMGNLLAGKAAMLFQLRRFEAARQTAAHALSTLHPDKSNYRFSAYSIQASILDSLGENQAAAKSRQFALDIATTDKRIERREVAKLLNEIGWIAYQNGDDPAAVDYAQRALHELYPTLPADDVAFNPDFARQDPDPENAVAEALDLKSAALWRQYRAGQQYMAPPALAFVDSTTALAIQMMENLRDVAVYESSQLQSARQSRRLFSRMLGILYAQQTNGDPGAQERAFHYTEKSKSVLLRRKVAADAALEEAGVADSLIRKKRDLREQQANLKNRLFEAELAGGTTAGDSLERAGWTRQLYDLDLTIRRLDTLIAARYTLSSHPDDSFTATLSDVQNRLLRPGEIWLEYYTDADDGWLYQIAISERGVQFARQPYRPAEIRTFIRLFNDQQQAQNRSGDPVLFKRFVQDSRALYQTLVGRVVPEQIPEYLTLAPDGALALLPFDVLLCQPANNPEGVDYGSLPYLVRYTRLRVAPSASLDLLYTELPRPEHRGAYAGFAPDYTNSADLAEVVAGSEVVSTAARAFGGQPYIGQKASLETFLDAAADQAIIHFHGHAEASDSFPDHSWLAFSAIAAPIAQAIGNQAGPGENMLGRPARIATPELGHFLFAHQVYHARLNADLVLLSACETGLGRIAPGEGTLSLARAFQAAGCPATVMSLWQVRDDASAQLMELFLDNIRGGQGKDEALANAKRTLLQETYDAFPYYWAGFVLTGRADPVQLPGGFWEKTGWWLVLIGGLSLFLGAWVWNRRGKF